MARSNAYRLTAQDKKTIRSAACKIASMQRCVLRVGVMSGSLADKSVNALLVSPTGRDGAETVDYRSWAEFTAKSIPLDANGDALIDLLIYEVPAVGENYVDLRDYAEVCIKAGKLEKIVSTCRTPRMEIAA